MTDYRRLFVLTVALSALTCLSLWLTACDSSPDNTELDGEGGAVTITVQPGLVFDTAVKSKEEVPAAEDLDAKATSYIIGTKDSDVLDMLEKVRTDKREEIVLPETFGDLTIDVTSIVTEGAADFDGNGQPDNLLLRWAVVPRPGAEVATMAWLVAVLADDQGTLGPDQEKNAVLLDAAAGPGEESPLRLGEVTGGKKPVVRYYKLMPNGFKAFDATARMAASEDKLQPAMMRDFALVDSAMWVYDTGVLAPEMAYVKAFIHKGYMPEVEAVEPTRDLVFPEILAPLYGSLKEAQARHSVPENASSYAAKQPLYAAKLSMLAHEGDLRLSLSADELRARMKGLQELGDQFSALEESLTLDGKKARRRDIENRLSEVSDPKKRAAVTKAYQDTFRPMVAEDGRYKQFIGEMNELARANGYRNYPDMRMVEKFGVDLDGFNAWLDESWKATEVDAQAFITSLKEFAGEEQLTYWQVGQLTDAWVLDQVGLKEMPAMSPEDARSIMETMYRDMGLDMSVEPYSNITMDSFQHDLKWNRSGTAATATPEQAYFTSNIKPGEPIPINEWETMVHETAHTLHYQTSGMASGGMSAYQNNMPGYVAEGVAMTQEEVAMANATLMKRYFGGKEGFTDKFLEVYPEARAQATAWQTRRLMLMASYEVNLYMDQDRDGNAVAWADRVGAWDGMVREKLFVEPPEDALAQIMCRSHPFDDQSMLNYGAYALGYLLVSQIRHATIHEGTDEEIVAHGVAIKELMAQGALANRDTAQEIINKL